MCSATIFKLLDLFILVKPHMEYVCLHMELSLVGIWQRNFVYLLEYILSTLSMSKEAGQLLMEHNILCMLERLPGYIGNWKELGHG